MGIVKSLFSRSRSADKPAAELAAVPTIPREPSAPNLVMLMPDASGIASYHLRTFVSARQAEAYLESILRGKVQEGTIMFWGLTSLPAGKGSQDFQAEPIVLIRDPERAGLVFTFSFVNLDAAYDFVRQERGLDLAQTMIFWAAPAEATADHWGEIKVTPGSPPTLEPTPNVGAPSAPLNRDESNGTRPRVSEWDTIAEPKTVDAPTHKAIAAVDISTVIDILEARGLRAPSSPPQPKDEPEVPDAVADGDETVHINLSDVFGGRHHRGTLTALDKFRRSRGHNANGVGAIPEAHLEAETIRGIVAAWSNIGAAIDEAIDAYVSRRVSATINWRRLTHAFAAAASVRTLVAWSTIAHALSAAAVARAASERASAEAWRRLTHAFTAAANVRMFVAWRAIAGALNRAASIHAARELAYAEVWRNATRACRQAAESKSGRRAKRLAWANISWTLEEAVYAARLQEKRAVAVEAAARADHKKKAEGSKRVKQAARTKKTKKAANGRSKTKAASTPVPQERSAIDARADAMDQWRSRMSGRFGEKKEPFNSFDSPPGRF